MSVKSTSIQIIYQPDGLFGYALSIRFANGGVRVVQGADYQSERVAASQAIRRRERLYEGRGL